MLDRLTPEQFDGWLAAWQIEAEDNEDVAVLLWRMLTVLKRGLSLLCSFALSEKIAPSQLDPGDDGKEEEEQRLSPEQMATLTKAALMANR